MTSAQPYSTGTYALVADTARVDLHGRDWGAALDDLVGDVKVRATSDQPVFVGIGPAEAVAAYLAGVPHKQLGDLGDRTGRVTAGAHTPAAPQEQSFWVASTSGAGEQTLRWNVQDGDWRAVVMAADGARAVEAQLAVGAELPALLELSLGLAGGGVLLLAVGGALLVFAVRDRS